MCWPKSKGVGICTKAKLVCTDTAIASCWHILHWYQCHGRYPKQAKTDEVAVSRMVPKDKVYKDIVILLTVPTNTYLHNKYVPNMLVFALRPVKFYKNVLVFSNMSYFT